MKRIELTQGQVALVDDEDFEWLSKWKWYAKKSYNTSYAVRNEQRADGKRVTVRMHREILQPPDDKQVDHINRNGLDNRRSNIRICTRYENGYNRDAYPSNASGYKGVNWCKAAQKWMARITANGKRMYLGCFSDKNDAARAYNEAALQLHGDFARGER